MTETQFTISPSQWEPIFVGDLWFYIHKNPEDMVNGKKGWEGTTIPIGSMEGKNRGSKGFSSPVLENSDVEAISINAQKKVKKWMEGNVYLFSFGYKRCALVDPEFPKGILLQDKDDIRIVKWSEYAQHGLKSLGMGKKTGGLTRKPATELKTLIENPTNAAITNTFTDIEGLIGKILSCAISEPLMGKNEERTN